jgi:hypothetical protein
MLDSRIEKSKLLISLVEKHYPIAPNLMAAFHCWAGQLVGDLHSAFCETGATSIP